MKIGIIGAGNMATAIIRGLIEAKMPPRDILISDPMEEKLEGFAGMGINTGTNSEAALFGDILILAVKPNACETVLNEIKGKTDGKTIVSIAAGISIGFIKSILGKNQRVVRTMPNTPALVGEGMTSISFEEPVNNDMINPVQEVFNAFGKTIIITESLMDAAVSVGGSSPAYAFMLIDAMAKKAVDLGMEQGEAVLAAAQSVMGAAKMVLETGEAPSLLKDKVCSPGGTTLEAVRVLEEAGFPEMVAKAMEACAQKSKQLKR